MADIDERLHTVERALTDSDWDLTELADAADHRARLETVEERVDELDAGSRPSEATSATSARSTGTSNAGSMRRWRNPRPSNGGWTGTA